MYPTTLFLNAYDKAKNEFQVKMLAPGFLEKKNIEPILVFMLENVFRNSGIDPFTQAFNTAFYGTTVTARIAKLPWKQPAAWFDGNEHEKKKTLVFLGTDWCNSCRVMERAVFTDSLLQSPLEKFALVKLNPEEPAPLFWNGKLYQKMPEDKFPSAHIGSYPWQLRLAYLCCSRRERKIARRDPLFPECRNPCSDTDLLRFGCVS
jgi:hypothetical protein